MGQTFQQEQFICKQTNIHEKRCQLIKDEFPFHKSSFPSADFNFPLHAFLNFYPVHFFIDSSEETLSWAKVHGRHSEADVEYHYQS